jgi:hypothetical protein
MKEKGYNLIREDVYDDFYELSIKDEVKEIIDNKRFWDGPDKEYFLTRGGKHSNWVYNNIANGGINLLYGLYDLIEENFNENFHIVEIGCYAGVSTELFSVCCEKVYAIDPWVDYPELPMDKIEKSEDLFDMMLSKHNNIVKIKDFSQNVYQNFKDESLDAVYIDGKHDYESVKRDILNWYPKVKTGGVISGHDFYDPSVNKVLKELFSDSTIKNYCDTSWSFKKII